MNKQRVAFMYDFDETLSPGYMQDYSLIPELGYSVNDFWNLVNLYGKDNNMDGILAYMYVIFQKAREKGIDFSEKHMNSLGKNIKLFKGVDTWFDRINKYGEEHNLSIEHYIISSGMKEIIDGTIIANKFKRIFACSYCYNVEGQPYWPKHAVNYTNKTQYIFRIRKNQMDDLNSSSGVNELLDDEDKLPYSHMFYFGDGQTDIPCMKLLKSKGGHSFCVYNPDSEKAMKTSIKLFKDGRVDYIAPADYSLGSDVDVFVKTVLDNISNDNKRIEMLKKYK